MRTRAGLVALVLLVSCSSAGAPGGGEVLGQLDKAHKAEVDVALTDAARAEAAYQAQNGTFTTDTAALGINPPASVTVKIASADATSYCIEATHASMDGTWHISPTTPGVVDGPC